MYEYRSLHLSIYLNLLILPLRVAHNLHDVHCYLRSRDYQKINLIPFVIKFFKLHYNLACLLRYHWLESRYEIYHLNKLSTDIQF